MNEPDPHSLDELRQILKELKGLDVRKTELMEQLRGIPAKIADEVEADSERRRLADELYWNVPQLNYYYVARDLLHMSKRRFEASVSPIDSGLTCEDCGQMIQYLNKEHRQDVNYRAGGRMFCDRCFEALKNSQAQKQEQQKREYEARQRQLAELPFHKYLQTQAWQERRGRHLEEFLCCCQLCGRRAFDVYHRTDERRGDEDATHLLALCPECYETNKRNDIVIER